MSITTSLSVDKAQLLKRRFGDPLPELLFPDLIYRAWRKSYRQRVDGYLRVGESTFDARSGSITYLPLPEGYYYCSLLQTRRHVVNNRLTGARQAQELKGRKNIGAMGFQHRENGRTVISGWSMHVEPMFASHRSALRIHPDGGAEGTEGCIGIIGERSSQMCFKALKALMNKHQFLVLKVIHNGSDRANAQSRLIS